MLEIQIENVAETSQLNPIDYLLWTRTGVYRSYQRDAKTFECARMLADTRLNSELLNVSPEDEENYARWVYSQFCADRRIERSRDRSLVRMLERKKLSSSEGSDLTYYVGGQGAETLVLLNAYGQSLAFWDKIGGLLLKRFRLIVWQARGTASQAGGVERVFSIQQHVDDLLAICQQEEVRDCHLVGWCTGPKVALELCAREPRCVRSLVFLTGCFKGFAGVEHLQTDYERHMDIICQNLDRRPEIAGAVMETLKSVVAGKQAVAPVVEERGSNDAHVRSVLALVPEDIKPLVLEPFATEQNVLNYARQLLAFWRHDCASLLPKGDIPLLFIGGELDNIAASEMSKEVARRTPGAVYAEVVAGSHYMQLDNSRLIFELIDKFTMNRGEFAFDSRQVQVVHTPKATGPAAQQSLHGVG